jgi:predicted HTH domain antitoxin
MSARFGINGANFPSIASGCHLFCSGDFFSAAKLCWRLLLFPFVRQIPGVIVEDVNTFTVQVELPEALRDLGVTDADVQREAPTLIVLKRFREGAISTGKAAELLGMSRLAFIEALAKEQVPVINYSKEEFEEEMKLVRELAAKR